MGILHEVEEDLLELVLVGPHVRTRGEVGHEADVVLLELVGLELQHAPGLVGDRAWPPLGRVVTREQQQILHDPCGTPRFLGDDAQPVAHVRGRLRVCQQQMRLPEDRRQRIVDFVRHARGKLADGRQLLGVDELRLGTLVLVEQAQRLGVESLHLRVELRVVERDADLVGGRLEQGQLVLVELVGGLAPERERAEDPPAAVDRHADEAADVVAPDGGPGRREHVRVLVVPLDPDGLAGDGHVTDEPFADRQPLVHLAEARGHAARASQLERLAVLGQQMEARDLVPGDAGERIQRGAQDLLDVERTADGLGDGVEDLEMRRDVGPAARRPAASLSPRRGATGAPLQALVPRAPAPWPGDHRTQRLCRGAARSRQDDHRRRQACRRRRR